MMAPVTFDHVTDEWVESPGTEIVTVFFLCPCKLFSMGATLGKHSSEKGYGRKGILLQMRMAADKSIKKQQPTTPAVSAAFKMSFKGSVH